MHGMPSPLNREPIRAVIRFRDDYSATLILGTDRKTGIVRERDESFRKGKRYPVAVFDDQGEYVNLTFPDGSELYGLKKELFEVVGAGSRAQNQARNRPSRNPNAIPASPGTSRLASSHAPYTLLPHEIVIRAHQLSRLDSRQAAGIVQGVCLRDP